MKCLGKDGIVEDAYNTRISLRENKVWVLIKNPLLD